MKDVIEKFSYHLKWPHALLIPKSRKMSLFQLFALALS